MTQAEKLEEAKQRTEARLAEAFTDFLQVGPHAFASMEEIGEDEIWTVTTIVAKKKFDIDEAISEWEFQQAEKAAKAAKRAQKKAQAAEGSAE